jgi:hypothetical protein
MSNETGMSGMNGKLAACIGLSILVIVVAVLTSWTIITQLQLQEVEQILVELRIDMMNSTKPYALSEANATWWVKTPKLTFQQVGQSGANVPKFQGDLLYLPVKGSDGHYLYCFPQLPDNYLMNQSKTIWMNPRVDMIAEGQFGNVTGNALRVWCDIESIAQTGEGFASLLYVTVCYSNGDS